MTTAIPTVRSTARRPLTSVAFAVLATITFLTFAFSSMAGATSAPEIEATVRIELNGGHLKLAALRDDPGMSFLASILMEQQDKADSQTLEFDALSDELLLQFEKVEPLESDIIYITVLIGGREFEACLLTETLVVTDSLLDGPTTVSQITSMPLD